MATTFQQIYNLADTISTDTRLKNKPSNIVSRERFRGLFFSIGKFLADCYKDLNQRIDFDEGETTFTPNIGDTEFTITNAPSDSDGIYVRITDGTTSHTYSYDTDTNILTISPAIANSNAEVFVSVFRGGTFTIDLSVTEQIILAQGMMIPLQEEIRNRNETLNQMTYNSDGKIHSQANHIKELNATIEMQYTKIVEPLIEDYSWKFSPNRLRGLSGRPNYTVTGGVYSGNADRNG